MPKIVSKAQYRLMQAVAHDRKIAEKVGISQATARAGLEELDRSPRSLPERVGGRKRGR